jgi:hypothetical protein
MSDQSKIHFDFTNSKPKSQMSNYNNQIHDENKNIPTNNQSSQQNNSNIKE